MPNINIDKVVYNQWNDFYNKHNKVDFPTLKNFTEKKLCQMMEVYGNL